MQLDVLAFAAHPDDVELSAGGTMCLLARQGYATAVVDLSEGELGTRGSADQRRQEARAASEVLGLTARTNLGLPDGDLANTKANQLKLIQTIRAFRPPIVLLNAPRDRHPDHGDAAALTLSALFYAGLTKVTTVDADGTPQEPWRPDHTLHYMQTTPFEPSLVVDVTDVWEERISALRSFKSQFYNPEYEPGPDEEETFISNPSFFEWVEARARTYGHMIGVRYGEPFLYHQGPIPVRDVVAAFSHKKRFK